ncbi:unnamed protein product [Ascophyllum nodosum]
MRVRNNKGETLRQNQTGFPHFKVRMMKAAVVEALLHGCATWTLRQEHYAKLRTIHHDIIRLRILGARRRRKRTDHVLSLPPCTQQTGCESIEAETIGRTRRLL